jgi:hypothetical protein
VHRSERIDQYKSNTTTVVYVTEEISSSLYDASLYMSLVCISSTSLHGGSEAKEMSATSSRRRICRTCSDSTGAEATTADANMHATRV